MNYMRSRDPISCTRMYRTLEYLRGISDSDVNRLRAVGIKHTNQLLHRTSLEIDRKRLSKRTGITTDRLLGFAHQCTLMEVSGMEHHLQTVRRFGIETLKDLRAQDADALHSKLADSRARRRAKSIRCSVLDQSGHGAGHHRRARTDSNGVPHHVATFGQSPAVRRIHRGAASGCRRCLSGSCRAPRQRSS